MTGTWEFSNAQRDKRCLIMFRTDPSTAGMKLEFDRGCATLFPFVRDIVGWTNADNDFLRLLDASGRSVLEFSELETGLYEAPREGEGILFIQNAAAAGGNEPTAEQVSGEWTIQRAGRTLCALTLSNTLAANERYAVRLQPGCDAVVTRFNPTSWQLARGEIVLSSARGNTWRFEEEDQNSWRRIPDSADPMLLVRK
jgi:hypothetical protein